MVGDDHEGIKDGNEELAKAEPKASKIAMGK